MLTHVIKTNEFRSNVNLIKELQYNLACKAVLFVY